jgi:hypothetical protein
MSLRELNIVSPVHDVGHNTNKETEASDLED